MQINQNFFNYIKPFLVKLKEEIGDDFVVFGSAPLYLLGIVDFKESFNDLDITIRDVANIPNSAEVVTFHNNPAQKFYKIKIDGMNIDIASTWPGYEEFFEKIFTKPIIVEGFKFANLDIVEEFKNEMVKKYNRQKDKDYLEKIKQFRSSK
jgi:hypothetical protein